MKARVQDTSETGKKTAIATESYVLGVYIVHKQ